MSDDSGVASGNENESDDIIFMNEDNNNNNNVDPVANIEVHIINNDNVENIVQDEPQAVDANDSRMNVDINVTNNDVNNNDPSPPPPSPPSVQNEPDVLLLAESVPSTSMDHSNGSPISMNASVFPFSLNIDKIEKLYSMHGGFTCQHDFHGKMRIARKRFYNTRLYPSDLIDEKNLRIAANTNDMTSLLRLLQKGVNPNASDDRDRTAIHFAASHGYSDIVSALLNFGADPNLKDTIGNTPLNLAFTAKKISTVHILLENGASLHTLDKTPHSSLILAKLKLLMLPDILTPMRLKSEIEMIFKSIIEDYQNDFFKSLHDRIKVRETKQEIKQDVDELLQYLENLSL